MIKYLSIAVISAAIVASFSGCASQSPNGATLPGGNVTRSGAPPIPSAGERVKIRQFSDLPIYYDYYGPSAITTGAGALWVTDTIDQDFGENVVVRIATNGKATNEYYYSGLTSEGASFGDITLGSDGNFWITDSYNEQILRMTPDGNYTGYGLHGFIEPLSITSGPDRALWFTEYGGIGRITTKGNVKIYGSSGSPEDIVTGPDGALWYTENQGDKIGRITTHGKITEYSNGITPGAFLWSIAVGPDGALWFTEYNGEKIGRITTKGEVTEYSSGMTPGEHPVGIVAGPDGAMWFTEYQTTLSYEPNDSKIGRIAMDGTIKEYSRGLTSTAAPGDITAGPDGRLWFVEGAINRVGRVKL